MTTSYAKHISKKGPTPQTEPIPGSDQVANSAGGFSFAVDDWTRLERFLVLGNEGGSYYATERKMTEENAKAVINCIKADGPRAVRIITDISVAGRAPKNDPAIFALALAAAHGNEVTKQAAYAAVNEVCRIGTHIFQFAEASNALRGWGRGLRRAISNWYTKKDAKDVAHQVTKYQQRNGFSHRDLLRLGHPKVDPQSDLNIVLNWAVKGWDAVGDDPHPREALHPIWAMERAKKVTTEEGIISLIHDYRLVRECIPTQWLNSPRVWEALLEKMPVTAMVRNLGKMSAIGLLTPLSRASAKVVDTLSDVETLKKGRVHPLALLMALKTYAQGHGDKGSLKWTPVQNVANALDEAFYLSFGAIKPTGKRWLLALDVSGSMSWGSIAGMAGITPRIGSAALALVTAAVEKQHHILGFSDHLVPINISPRQRLDSVIQTIEAIPMGGTNCSLPMQFAMQNKLAVDAFVVLTDSETFAGNIHPSQAIQEYRQKSGIGAKLIVCGMQSNGFTIADPDDAGMMDVVGFDTAVPAVMSEFVGYKE